MPKNFLTTKYIQSEFIIQWHLTDKCDRNCLHCYIPQEKRVEDKKTGLSKEECFKVIDDLNLLTKKWGLRGRINFTGGNPLLRNDFPQILEYSSKKEIINCILGNPYPLDAKNLHLLKKNNVFRYQISIDGLKETHDSIRGKGSFKESIEGINKLSKEGIWVSIMSTMTKQNYKELPKLAEISFKEGARHFDFARIVPIGTGKQLENLCLNAEEYHKFLYTMYNTYCELKEKGAKRSFLGTKDPLWRLLFSELGLLESFKKDGTIYSGCSIGLGGLVLDVDGTAYSCRRLPKKIGDIRESSLLDIFINSEELNEQREYKKIKGCGDCEIMPVCRGCRAVAWADSGDYFEKDPQCWKEK